MISIYDKGDIKGFPLPIVDLMLKYQEEQCGHKDIKVFEEDRTNNKDYRGFDWYKTPEGCDFWENVLTQNKWELFFERYPDSMHSMSDLHIETEHLEFENLFD